MSPRSAGHRWLGRLTLTDASDTAALAGLPDSLPPNFAQKRLRDPGLREGPEATLDWVGSAELIGGHGVGRTRDRTEDL